MDFNIVFITAILSLGILSSLFFVKTIKEKEYSSSKLNEIDTLEQLILGTATLQYIITLSYIPNTETSRIQRWRYLDWLITTPLLLKTFHSLAEEKGYKYSFTPALIANIIMIYSGYHAEFLTTDENSKRLWYIIGFIALFIVLFYVNKWDTYLLEQNVDTEYLPYFFYFGWTLYGVNFINPNEQLRQIVFNVLDIINKGIYSLQLEKVIDRLN